MPQLSVSILSSDFSKLGSEAQKIERGGAHMLHIDVMDGHFVPNISFGADVMKSLNGCTSLDYDVHLMIENPDMYLESFMTEKTRYITVHSEACASLPDTLRHIKKCGAGAGVSIKPKTPASAVADVLADVDMVLVMSVEPGFGGQKFMESALPKISELASIRKERGLNFLIEVDGGINFENAKTVVEAGVDVIVAGSALTKKPDVEQAVREFVKL